MSHITGPLWFLLALFWARLVYEGIKYAGRWCLPLAIIIGLIAYIVGQYQMDNRLFITHGLCALPFVAIGGFARQIVSNEEIKNRYAQWIKVGIILCVLCWVVALAFSHLEMRACAFGCWPVDVLGACGASYLLFKAVTLFSRNRIIAKINQPIVWCGRYSLALLCMHGIEWRALLPIEQQLCDGWILLIVRFAITIALSLVVVYLPGLKKIYR